MLPIILGLVGGGLIVSAFTEGKKYAKGGSIPNNYEGKTPEQVWNEWSVEQREHFLQDHNQKITHFIATDPKTKEGTLVSDIYTIYQEKENPYKKLNKHTKFCLDEHINHGQYAKGGSVKKGAIYEVGIDEGKDGTRTLADFETKKDADNFMYEYILKHPKAKLFIDNVTFDSKMAKGGEIEDIEKKKKGLIAKAKSKGIYENFGQKEVRELEDKYGNTPAIRNFDNWAMNYDSSMMAKGGQTKREPIMIKKEGKKGTGTKKPNAQTNKMKEVIAHAKATRKDGEVWKTAVARAWKEMK